MVRYVCRACGEEVEDTGEVLFCPAHPKDIVDSVLVAGEDIHAELWSERRRNTVLLCDTDRILPHTETTKDDTQVTCPRCQRLLDGTHRWDDARGQWIRK